MVLVVLVIIGLIVGEPEPEATTAGGAMSTPTVEAAPTPTVETAAGGAGHFYRASANRSFMA